MNKFEGVCVGGPDDGKRMAHWSKAKEYLRPVSNALSLGGDDTPIIPAVVGTYHMNDFGQWMWHETKVGRALRDLDDVV